MARTEGWPAAVYLAALAGSEQLPYRHVSEYLASEVLDGLDAAIRDFLTRTAVLPRLSAALCDHVLEREDSAATLEALVRENLFVTVARSTAGSAITTSSANCSRRPPTRPRCTGAPRGGSASAA